VTTSNTAQSKKVSSGTSTPRPEYRRLDVFVGNWSMEGQQYDGPFGPNAKVVAVESYEWLAGGFFLLHRLGGKLDSTEIACMEIIGFDEATQNYPRYTFYGNGKTNEWQSQATDTGWTLIGDSTMGDKSLKVRCTIVMSISGEEMTSKWEYSSDGADWKTFWDVKATKAG
jgi:Protein of unknown function (DUF1579)